MFAPKRNADSEREDEADKQRADPRSWFGGEAKMQRFSGADGRSFSAPPCSVLTGVHRSEFLPGTCTLVETTPMFGAVDVTTAGREPAIECRRRFLSVVTGRFNLDLRAARHRTDVGVYGSFRLVTPRPEIGPDWGQVFVVGFGFVCLVSRRGVGGCHHLVTQVRYLPSLLVLDVRVANHRTDRLDGFAIIRPSRNKVVEPLILKR